MNQQNPQNRVHRTVQRRGAGGQLGMTGAQPQANTQFGFGSAQSAPQGQPAQYNQYGQRDSYGNAAQPYAQQYQPAPVQQPYQHQVYPQQQYAQPMQVAGGQVVQTMPTATHEQQWADPTYVNATLGQRFGAYLIDGLIVWILQMVVWSIFAGGGSLSGSDEAAIGGMVIALIIMSVLWVVYKICLEGIMGRTLGKKILGLRLIPLDGRPMSMGHAFKRNFNLFYGLIPFVGLFAMNISMIVRFFSVMNSPYNQGYHDRWGNTRLIKES